MFTGLVQALGTIACVCEEGSGKRLGIASADYLTGVVPGDSVAVNGCCLTVVEVTAEMLTFEAGPETLGRTNLGNLDVGNRVNLEKSLLVGDDPHPVAVLITERGTHLDHQKCGSCTKGDQIAEAIQLSTKIRSLIGQSGHAAVDRVEQHPQDDQPSAEHNILGWIRAVDNPRHPGYLMDIDLCSDR